MLALAQRCAKSVRMICAAVALTWILCHVRGDLEGAVAAGAHKAFADFNAKVEIDIEDGEIEAMANFTLGAGSNGIDLANEPVTFLAKGGTGAFSVTLSPGAFKKDGSARFMFQGSVDRVKLQASVRALRDGVFEFEMATEGANLKGFANPVSVTLTVGDDSGGSSVRAKIE